MDNSSSPLRELWLLVIGAALASPEVRPLCSSIAPSAPEDLRKILDAIAKNDGATVRRWLDDWNVELGEGLKVIPGIVRHMEKRKTKQRNKAWAEELGFAAGDDEGFRSTLKRILEEME